jgi:hypothetical protein
VQAVAAAMLRPDNRAVLVYEPVPQSDAAQVADPEDHESEEGESAQ